MAPARFPASVSKHFWRKYRKKLSVSTPCFSGCPLWNLIQEAHSAIAEVPVVIWRLKWILKIPPHLAYVATLPCYTLMSAKEALNDRLQGSVAAYLKCGGVVNNQDKNGLSLSL